ncbi:MAG: alpha/beta hydrolase fold domain-containing protein [Gammaproteobacteria bacterium]
MAESDGNRGIPVDPLDPQIRRFVTAIGAAFAAHPPLDRLAPAQARRIAEAVRAPWRQGGPQMRHTLERRIPTGQGEIRIRVYDPGAEGIKAGLIYLHGGGWTLFSLDTHDRVMREYAARSGASVIGVDYPLSPEAKFPQALGQIVALMSWLGAHARELGVDPDRLAIGGDSAGANLSVATCLALRVAGEPERLKGMLLNYGAFDSSSSEEAVRRFGGDGFPLSSAEMKQYWSNYLRSDADLRDPLACPLLARLEHLPPAFLTIPECDILTEQSLRMADRLREAGVPVHQQVYAGATHSFLEAVSVSDLASRALEDGAAWLHERLA